MIEDYTKIFFTSDQHFGHTNILKYCDRPFLSIEEMNETIIKNWNSIVNKEDTTYVVGDITMKYGKTRMKEIFDQLNGTKILITGNHDNKGNIPSECFLHVLKRLHITGEGYDFILIHDPAEASANHMNDQKYLCGHLHSSPDRKMYYNWYDVGVDANNFTPISLENILKQFEDETKKGFSTDELLLRSTSSYNQYAQRRCDSSRTPHNIPKALAKIKCSLPIYF